MKFLFLVLLSALVLPKFVYINNLPIFYDEAIYLTDAQNVFQGKGLFRSFDTYQMPLFSWFLTPLNLLGNKLEYGRYLNVIIDVCASFVIGLIGLKLTKNRFGLFAGLIYLVLPLTFIHSRTIIIEPLMNLFLILGAYYLVTNRALSMILFLTLAVVTKPVVLIVLPAFFFMANRQGKMYLLLSIFLFLVTYGLLADKFLIHASLNKTISSILKDTYFNFHRIFLWALSYLGIMTLVLLGMSLSVFSKKTIFIFLWIFLVPGATSILAHSFFPRHLFLICAPVAILICVFLNNFRFGAIAISLFILSLLYIDTQFILYPKNVLVGEDRIQFFENWSSGIGLSKIKERMSNLTGNLFIENDRMVYFMLQGLDEINVLTKNELNHDLDFFLKNNDLTKVPSYVLLSHNQNRFLNQNMNLVYEYKRTQDSSLRLYKYNN